MAKQEVNSPLIVVTGIISVLLLVVSAVGVEAWFRYEEQAEVQAKWQTNQNTWLADIRKEERANLDNGYHWNAKRTAATVPIEQAMRIVAQNQGKTR
jgi:hypothetical protein